MPTVKTTKGLIEGIQEAGYQVYKGIPYAKPPVGDLRFHAPVEPEPWEGVKEAKTFPNMCPQRGHEPGEMYTIEFYENPDFMPGQSEDCLYLNVWTPDPSASPSVPVASPPYPVAPPPYPVAVWIHGGAFMGGFGSELEFDGEAYAKRGVILVTINYRLGVFGFLNHPWLAEEDEGGHCGNYGILDQIAALKWVQENIAAFGGDPERVTVFGQSAGAMSTQTLLSSPLTKGMIQRAILQSGGGYDNGLNRDMSVEEAMEVGKGFVTHTGASSLKELRAKSLEEINEAFGKTMMECFQSGKGLVFVPTIDGYVLPKGYNAILEEGLHPDIPYMLGSTANDIFVPKEDGGQPKKSNLHKGCLAWSKKGQELGRKPSYVYYFTRQLPGDDNGAFHSAELWYMMGTVKRCWRPMEERDYALSEKMMAYWTNFMKTGDPNKDGEKEETLLADGTALPEWKPCTAEGEEYLVFS